MDERNLKFVCVKCGSKDVQVRAEVELNSEGEGYFVVEWYDEEYWCGGCNEWLRGCPKQVEVVTQEVEVYLEPAGGERWVPEEER